MLITLFPSPDHNVPNRWPQFSITSTKGYKEMRIYSRDKITRTPYLYGNKVQFRLARVWRNAITVGWLHADLV